MEITSRVEHKRRSHMVRVHLHHVHALRHLFVVLKLPLEARTGKCKSDSFADASFKVPIIG